MTKNNFTRTVRYATVLGGLSLMLTVTTLVFAESGETSVSVGLPKPPLPGVIKAIREDAQVKIQTGRENLKEDVRDIRSGSTTPTGKRLEIKNEVRDTRGGIKNEREDMRGKIENARTRMIKNEIKKVVERFRAAIERLQKLAERIDSRIKKFEVAGADMTIPKAKLLEAQAKIDIAKVDVNAVLSFATNFSTTTGTTTKGVLDQAKGLAKAAERAIQAAQKALADTVASMKPGLEWVKDHASTTKDRASTTNEHSD